MNKYIIYILFGLIVIGAGFYFYQNKAENNQLTTQYNIDQITTIHQKNNGITDKNLIEETVPLPTEEDIIRTFFSLINDRQISEAVMMMSSKNTGDDSTKQAWGVQFNAIKSINIQAIEPSMKENWTQDRQSYKTILEAYVSSEAANAPIPYYGWQDNPNIRWITIVKENNLWKIDEIATGP